MDPLIGEVATAAITPEAILKGTPSYGMGREGIAGSLPKNAARLVAAYIRRDKPAALGELPPFDYDEVSDLLANAGKPEQLEALDAAIDDPELSEAVKVEASRIIEILQDAKPARTVEGLAGSVAVPPSAQELARFRRVWQVANDPLVVLRDLNDDSMSIDQAQALEALYPSLYATLKSAVLRTFASIKAKKPDWAPGYRKESRLRVLLQVPAEQSLASDMQAIYAKQKAEAKPKSGSQAAANKAAQGMQTPAQANEAA